MPIEVPLSCIAAGCRPGGTVLDMFAGTAVTGLAARALGRSFIGVALTEDQCRLAARTLSQDTDSDGDVQ
jgi:DNA modification methylase